uniref:Cytochrome P450 n=1 Tax=Nilaparvata lugens TaxID=108931 RepID=B3GVW4_NILLU|nr:cytochrome P450 [Nilaparvata lugens]
MAKTANGSIKMDYTTTILSLVLFIFSALYLLRQAFRRIKIINMVDQLPGPRAYPIIGNALDFMVPRSELMNVFDSRTKKYGPLFRTWAGPVPQIHITRPEHMEIVMSSLKHIDKSKAYTFLQPGLGTGLLTGTGAKWHSHRKMITPTLHFKILDVFVEVFGEKCQTLIENLLKKADGQEFDIYPFITHCALDIICETAMGTQINAQNESDSDYVRAIYDISELTTERTTKPWLHSDLIWKSSKRGARYAHDLSILHGFTNRVISERKVARLADKERIKNHEDDDEFLGKKKRMAFLDLLLEASELGQKLTDDEIREEVDTFMFEGHDTTTAGICWSLFMLGNHPEYQDQVAQELDQIFGDSNLPPTMKDLNEMKYLERVIKESLRLFPSVPFIGRYLGEDTKFDNYIVPAGCVMNLQIFHVHRCPDQFPDPEKFNPDNFLPERTQGRHPYAYIPFSAGPRNCIGQKFAVLEEKTVLSSILRNYRVESVEKLEDLNLMNELILRPESGIRMRIYPRKKTQS